MTRDAHLNEDADFERRMKATAAYEDAMDAVLHDDYGNFMELLMVTREMADDGDKKAIAKIEQMTALLKKAKAAGEAARAKVLKEAVEDTQRPELKGLNKSYFDIGKKDGLTDRQRGKTSRPKASLSHDKDYVSGYQEGFKSETGKTERQATSGRAAVQVVESSACELRWYFTNGDVYDSIAPDEVRNDVQGVQEAAQFVERTAHSRPDD
jgi:peptidyl-tRNA hydrolase